MVFQSMKMAVKSILSNKMRSFLTMLGIIIGVVALVVLVSLVDGATSSVTDSISSLGSNLLSVTISDDYNKPLSLQDVEDLQKEDTIKLTAPVGNTSVTGKYNTESDTVQVYGTTSSYSLIQEMTVATGRFIKTTDVDNHTNVAVVNAALAEDLVGNPNCLGETISLNGMKYKIVGILEEDDSLTSSMMGDSYIAYIPYTSLMRLSTSVSSVTTFYATAADEENADAAETTLTNYFMNRFEQDEDAFSVTNQSEIADALSSVTGTLQLLLGGIAGISLLVGGIGIMNIMLVSVTERTREIGIRKAIGAARSTIMLQFLIEALFISMLGCAFGITLSWIILKIVTLVGGTTFTLSMGVVLISILFSLAIGVLFGMYPANKAAKKPPIEALRFGG